MRQNHILENVSHFGVLLPRLACIFLRVEFCRDVLNSLIFGQNIRKRALLESLRDSVQELGSRAYHLCNLLVALHAHRLECNRGRDVLLEQVVGQVEAIVFLDHSCARLLLVGGRGDLRAKILCLWVNLNNDPVLGHLLLDLDDFLHALHNEVASGVIRTLLDFGEVLSLGLGQPAVLRAEHDGHVTDQHVRLCHDPLALSVLDVHVNGRRVSHVANAALMRHDFVLHGHLGNHGHPHVYVREFEKEALVLSLVQVLVNLEDRIRFHNVLDADLDEVVVRVDVLLHKTSDPQERWNQFPLILQRSYCY